MKDLGCPYCNEWCEVDHEDGIGYEQDCPHEMECPHCEKSFIFYTSILFSYSPQAADCLNNGKHDYKPTHTYPKEFTKMICAMCGDKREFTDKERIEFFKNKQ